MCDCKVGPGKFEGEGPLTFLMSDRVTARAAYDEDAADANVEDES